MNNPFSAKGRIGEMNLSWINPPGTNEDLMSYRELRQFGLTMAGALSVLFGFFFPWVLHRSFPIWPWVAAIVFGSLGIFSPLTLKWIHALWMKFAHVLGFINTRILLGIIYFLVFVPMGCVLRLLSRDPLVRRFEPNRETYRIPRKPLPPSAMDHPF